MTRPVPGDFQGCPAFRTWWTEDAGQVAKASSRSSASASAWTQLFKGLPIPDIQLGQFGVPFFDPLIAWLPRQTAGPFHGKRGVRPVLGKGTGIKRLAFGPHHGQASMISEARRWRWRSSSFTISVLTQGIQVVRLSARIISLATWRPPLLLPPLSVVQVSKSTGWPVRAESAQSPWVLNQQPGHGRIDLLHEVRSFQVSHPGQKPHAPPQTVSQTRLVVQM